MRGFLKPIAAIPLAAIALAMISPAMISLGGLGRVAIAQQSADAIISALKPSGNLVTGSTRGIRLGGSVPAAREPSAAHPASTSPALRPQVNTRNDTRAPAAPAAGPSINLTVNFPTGSADLTPAARASLDALGKALASNDLAGFRFRIEGHTDNVGSRDENLNLSQRRAEAVVSYLTSQYNVAPPRLEAVGMGQEQPLIETPPQTPEARNRRVQVINLGA